LLRGPAGTATATDGWVARDSRAASMSPLVTRPSRPVPATDDVERPLSAAMRWADGMAGTSVLGAARAGAGAAVVLGASAFGEAAVAVPALPSAMAPSSAPTVTVAPAPAVMDSIA